MSAIDFNRMGRRRLLYLDPRLRPASEPIMRAPTALRKTF